MQDPFFTSLEKKFAELPTKMSCQNPKVHIKKSNYLENKTILPQTNPLNMQICIMTTLLEKIRKTCVASFSLTFLKKLYKPTEKDSPNVREHPGQKFFLQLIFFQTNTIFSKRSSGHLEGCFGKPSTIFSPKVQKKSPRSQGIPKNNRLLWI